MTVSDAGRWSAAPYSFSEAHALARTLGVSETLAAVLVRRGLGDPAAARAFLAADESHDPGELGGMAEAAALVLEHVRRGSQIVVHGDYDVDGVCSTAVLVRALRDLGADVRARLPSRSDDGYGLSRATVEELRARGAALLVTVDCGIGAVDEVAFARSLGMDVVVTDHHRPGDELPDCPVVHPALGGYPCAELCATGVAYKLAQALFASAGRDPVELETELDVVALATVADLVPLRGENRTLVRRGLKAIAGTRRPGLRELMRVAGVDPQSVTEQTLGFGLGPRINAAGRLYRADAGLELLLTPDTGRAREIARELDAVNAERQGVESAIVIEAEEQLAAAPERLEDPVLVLAGEGWHAGVVGIVASRLVERHHRPCVVIALDGKGGGRGSARSICAYDLHAGLASAAEHLTRFGGHRMAAGVELEEAALEDFRAALVSHARSCLGPEDLVRTERVDAVVPGDAVSLALAEEIASLRPFGMGNPPVSLLLPAARVAELRSMGEGRHARFTVMSAGVRARAVAFGVGDGLNASVDAGPPDPRRRHDVTARLEVNEWGGAVEPRLVVRSVLPLAEPQPEAGGGCAGCSCRATGERWWEALRRELDAPLEPPAASAPGSATELPAAPARTVVDRRGEGALGVLSDLMSTGESLLVVAGDVSRRRGLFERELDPERFGHPPLACASGRCAGTGGPAAPAMGGVCLADPGGLAADRSLHRGFRHVFVLDPLPFPESMAALHEGPSEESFLHLGWGPAELEFARRVLEHELALRPVLASVFRALAALDGPAEGDVLEACLSGGGEHPRSPAQAARCLRVMTELGLLSIERSSATVRCTIRTTERVELERSSAYRAYARAFDEGLRFLSEQTLPATRRRAA